MTTDGLFRLHQVDVKTKNGEPWTLVPFGDVHRDSPGFSDDKWAEFIEFGKRTKNALFLGCGDYLDGFSMSERIVMRSEALHDSTRKRNENEGKLRLSALAKELSFMRGKCIGIMSGNHYQEYPNGTTSDNLLAEKLCCPFLGVCAYVRISFEFAGNKGRNTSIDILAHHGRGQGMTAGGRMNAVEKLQAIADADIYLMGHNHARGVLPLGDRLKLDHGPAGLFVRARRQWIGRTGSFLKAYEPNESSYVVDKALPPASLGWISFTLIPRRIRTDNTNRVTVDIEAHQ